MPEMLRTTQLPLPPDCKARDLQQGPFPGGAVLDVYEDVLAADGAHFPFRSVGSLVVMARSCLSALSRR